MSIPNVLIFENQKALSYFTAAFFTHLAQEAVANRGQCFFALSGGGTPRPVFELLGREPYRETFPWFHTHFLLGDERLVPTDHPESNLYQAQIRMLDPAGVPPENIHPVNHKLEPAAAAADYAATLQALAEPGRPWPRLDIALNGLGADGHTASLFPAAENPVYTAPVIAVTATYEDRPAHRVTMTPPILNDARCLVYLVAGEKKAAAVAAALDGTDDPAGKPTHRLHPVNGRTIWLLDEAAAKDLTFNARQAPQPGKPDEIET